MPRLDSILVQVSVWQVALLRNFAVAWAPDGHERIARIAQGLLSGKHSDQIRSMMHSDVIDIADWEAKMTTRYPETDPLHWHRQQPEWTCGSYGGVGDKGHVRCDGHGAENGSLFCALAYFFEHFAHDALLQEYPEPNEPIVTPESLPVLAKIPSSELRTSNYLRWLTILIGDLHQPLHWLHEHSYGKDIKVIHRGVEHTLFSLWEDFLPKQFGPLNKMHPDMTDKDYGKNAQHWAHKAPTELFREWAKEMSEKVCSEIYAPMTVNHADGTRVDNPYTLGDEQYEKWKNLAEEVTSAAGERLAFVLNDIIEHKRHKEAHAEGRALPSRKVAVGTKRAADLDPNINKHRPDFNLLIKQLKVEDKRRKKSNAVYNLIIAAVIVPSLLFAFQWHERVGGGSVFALAKHLKQ